MFILCMSIDSIKAEKLNRVKTKLQAQGHAISPDLKLAFVTGATTRRSDLLSTLEQEPLVSAPSILINKGRTTLRPRPPRLPKRGQRQKQKDLSLSSQQSQSDECPAVDTKAILDQLQPFLTRMRSQTSLKDSQSAILPEGKSSVLQELLQLSIEEVNVACEHIDFSSWEDDTLSDLCHAFGSVKNLGYPVACAVIQSSLFPHIKESTASLSRILTNSVLQLGKSSGNVTMNALVLPLLNSAFVEKNAIVGRPQMELISKLITTSFSVSSRTMLTRLILNGDFGSSSAHCGNNAASDPSPSSPPSDSIMQLLNTLLSSQPPITLDASLARQLIQKCHQVIQKTPKDKTSMQVLLTLTSKHAQSLVEANVLDDLEATASQSDIFLKRSVLGQVSSIRHKT